MLLDKDDLQLKTNSDLCFQICQAVIPNINVQMILTPLWTVDCEPTNLSFQDKNTCSNPLPQ